MMFKMNHPIKRFASLTKNVYSLTYTWQNKKGFTLFSVLISTGISMTLVMLWVSSLALTTKTWTQIYTDIVLLDAGRFMQGVIDKDVGYESNRVIIRKDVKGSHILECQNLCGNKTITIYTEDVRLLKKIKTGNGTGANALYINGCNVEKWQVKAIDNKKILISFWLKKNENKKLFKQIVHCYNGEIINNA